MTDEAFERRLSQIATRWSLLRQAHAAEQDQVQQAQAALFERYQRAIYRYLVASLRDLDAADEVFQQFSVRLVEGRFHRAAPDKGRFRDYLKKALGRLIIDYRRQAGRRGVHLGDDPQQLAAADSPAAAENEVSFERNWRDELLQRTWEALQQHERESGRPYYSVLHHRTTHDAQSSEEMAAALTEQLQPARPLNAASARKMLQRAREWFAAELLREVSVSVGSEQADVVEQELIALDLLPYCRSAFQRRYGR